MEYTIFSDKPTCQQLTTLPSRSNQETTSQDTNEGCHPKSFVAEASLYPSSLATDLAPLDSGVTLDRSTCLRRTFGVPSARTNGNKCSTSRESWKCRATKTFETAKPCETSEEFKRSKTRVTLVGGAITILKNMSSSMGRLTSHIYHGTLKKCLKPSTSTMLNMPCCFTVGRDTNDFVREIGDFPTSPRWCSIAFPVHRPFGGWHPNVPAPEAAIPAIRKGSPELLKLHGKGWNDQGVP